MSSWIWEIAYHPGRATVALRDRPATATIIDHVGSALMGATRFWAGFYRPANWLIFYADDRTRTLAEIPVTGDAYERLREVGLVAGEVELLDAAELFEPDPCPGPECTGCPRHLPGPSLVDEREHLRAVED